MNNEIKMIRETEFAFVANEANGKIRIGIKGVRAHKNVTALPFDFAAMDDETFENVVSSYVLTR